MTPDEIRERANRAMESIYTDDDEDYASARAAIEIEIRAAVDAAVAEERAACAKVADDHVTRNAIMRSLKATYSSKMAERIADEIRARGGGR